MKPAICKRNILPLLYTADIGESGEDLVKIAAVTGAIYGRTQEEVDGRAFSLPG
jgi:hypothetical protein